MIEVTVTMDELRPFVTSGDYDGFCRYTAEKLKAAGIPVKDDKYFYCVRPGRLECLGDPLTWTKKVYQWTP